MSTVTLNIGPKSYTVACADGQEAHITALGAMIAEKYAQLGNARAPLEAQNLLFAALFMADELAEARKSLESSGLAPAAPAEPDTAALDALKDTIARLETELSTAREAVAAPASAEVSAPAPASSAAPQPDLFGGPAPVDPLTEAVADRIEALAARAEASAAALEAAAANA